MEDLVEQESSNVRLALEELGFSKQAISRALHFTKGTLDDALNWIDFHQCDNDFNDPLPPSSSPSSSLPLSSSAPSVASIGGAAAQSPATSSSSSSPSSPPLSLSSSSSSALAPSSLSSSSSPPSAGDVAAMLAMLGDNMALPYKLVLVVRTDLNMQKGKMMAQCAHAAVGTVLELQESKSTFLRPWLNQGQPKIVVKANSVVEIFALEKQAKTVGVPTYAIHDAGRTQVAAGSLTVLAVGPAPAFLVDQVTKDLKLM